MSEYVALSVIKFKDGTLSAQPLHRGTEGSCREVAEMLSAISYSGPKPVDSGYISIMPAEHWEAVQQQHRESIHHVDGDVTNNSPENIRHVDPRENR